MGKNRYIDHRRPPREAGIPKVLRGGQKVDPHPEPESPEEKKRRETLLTEARRADTAEERLRVKDIEVKALKQQVIDARDAANAARRELLDKATEPTAEDLGEPPKRIDIVQVDDITKNQSTATLQVLVEVDGLVGDSVVTVPVDQLKQIIRQKRSAHERNHEPRGKEPVSELRGTAASGDVPDVAAVETTTGGADVPELRPPRTEGTDADEYTV